MSHIIESTDRADDELGTSFTVKCSCGWQIIKFDELKIAVDEWGHHVAMEVLAQHHELESNRAQRIAMDIGGDRRRVGRFNRILHFGGSDRRATETTPGRHLKARPSAGLR